jgi:hypothetical protein
MKSKYVCIELVGPSDSGKTEVHQVLTADRLVRLGMVSWYAPWRKYVFHPSGGTLYDPNCLRDIADSVDGLNRQHREGKKEAVAK